MIVSSKIVDDGRQRDGRRWITESHVDQFGVDYRVMYLCPADWDADAAMKLRAKQIEADIEAQSVELVRRTAAQAKVESVLRAAVTKGTITADDLEMAGR